MDELKLKTMLSLMNEQERFFTAAKIALPGITEREMYEHFFLHQLIEVRERLIKLEQSMLTKPGKN